MAAMLTLMIALAPLAASAAEITVYKSPYCGCCGGWVDHMRSNGHSVKTVDLEDLTTIKKMTGVGEELQSCHTAVVDGYVIEGHVPAQDVARLLAERPKAKGLTVPGMPTGTVVKVTYTFAKAMQRACSIPIAMRTLEKPRRANAATSAGRAASRLPVATGRLPQR